MRVAAAQVAITGPPFGFYPRMPTDTVEVAVGFPVSATVTADGDVTAFELPGGRVVTGTHVGSYESLEASYRQLTEWAAAEGYSLADHMWEAYGPSRTPPPGRPGSPGRSPDRPMRFTEGELTARRPRVDRLGRRAADRADETPRGHGGRRVTRLGRTYATTELSAASGRD